MPVEILNREIPKTEVRRRAQDVVSQHFDDSLSSKENLIRLVGDLDGIIRYVRDDREETIHINGDGTFEVFLSQHSSALRDNFTLAHELGHLILHVDLKANFGESVTLNRRGHDRREWEANWFAAELLMPSDEFRRVANQVDNDVVELASHFDVSISAAEVRLRTLGIQRL